MLYAGEAFEVAAPTSDPTVLESEIAVLGPGVMPGGGSRPAAALALARDMLKDGEAADVVLVSDGGGIDDAARAEAERLAAAGIRLSALVLSASAGGSARPDDLTALADAAAPAAAPEPVLGRLGQGARRRPRRRHDRAPLPRPRPAGGRARPCAAPHPLPEVGMRRPLILLAAGALCLLAAGPEALGRLALRADLPARA